MDFLTLMRSLTDFQETHTNMKWDIDRDLYGDKVVVIRIPVSEENAEMLTLATRMFD